MANYIEHTGNDEMLLSHGVTVGSNVAGTAISSVSNDSTLAANSATIIPTQQAVKAYNDGTSNIINDTASGIWAAPRAITYTVWKINNGRFIAIEFPQNIAITSGAPGNSIQLTTALPAEYRPTTTIRQAVIVQDNTWDIPGQVQVTVNGIIFWEIMPRANWTPANPGGSQACWVMYRK